MEKKRYSVRDTIPETPNSFYDTVERSLSVCRSEKKEISWGGFRLNRRLLIPLVVILTLLITGTALAAGVLLRGNYNPTGYIYNPTGYIEDTKEKREEQGQTIPDLEQAIESAAPKSGDYKIVMLPEFKNAAEQDEWRVKMGQPKYNEADWSWVRDIKPEIDEVLTDGRTLAFNIRLNTDHAKAFTWPDVEGQWVDALVDGISFRREGEAMAHPITEGGGGVNPSMVADTSAVLYTDVILDQQGVDFPTEGRVELTVEIGLRDARVADLALVGNVAKIYYTFSFDVTAGADVAPPQITERKLSGSIVMTVDDWSNPDNPKLYNKRVSLDGVVLREEIHYKHTGIYVTYTVKEAPESWIEAMKTSLVYPNREAKWYGLYVDYRLGKDGEWAASLHENHGNFGEQTVILPIFPSDYETVKKEGCTLRLTEYYGTAFNGTPIDENWELAIGSGAMTLDFELASQELMTLEIPLP